ncbi:hypothetical protein Tco_0889985, partial [Tanacetum coccineum]
ALMNVPIFVGTFSVVADFAVLEDMDAYRDEGMGDVIFGEPFLREVGIKARWFDGMITIYNGNESEVVLFYNGLDVPTRQILDSRGAIPSKIAADAKEKDPGSFTLPCFINNVCFDNALADLGASVSVMPLSTNLNLGLGDLAHTKLIVELADWTMKYPKGIAENVLVGIGKFVFLVDFIILDMPEDVKVPLILGRPFLSTAHAKIDVFERKITLRVGEERIVFKSVKPGSSLIKRVYMLSFKKRMELDLEARLMRETLVLNRSLDPFFEDYIELNDLNVPLELRRDQVDDLMPTIEECEVIEEFRARNNARMVSKIFRYPSDCDHDKKIYVDYAHNLKFSCMIDFAVLEDMDAYRDEEMGDCNLPNALVYAGLAEIGQLVL